MIPRVPLGDRPQRAGSGCAPCLGREVILIAPIEEEPFMESHDLPGSHGEHLLQERYGSVSRARAFYQKQMLHHINPHMRQFVAKQEMLFLATSDGKGECDCSLRVGEKGFLRVLDERTLLYPEYRGNGVHASLGNIVENPHVALMLLDFFRAGIGLHVNGRASIWTPEELVQAGRLPVDNPQTAAAGSRQPELWIMVAVEEAYIHCSKHIPLFVKRPKEIDWGTDDVRKKGGDYFHAKGCDRPWSDGSANGVSAG
jgi:predicted pyridoxine 5'-phosphate oxidase superfamily flavin-nucleotide-binding protein